ncbi:putative Disease resistance protein RPM1 [Tripterygium wilfordii]|uniref:Putative Disease resistance protein RPM1 n=1 Tax=Tripterygium wilfordii TaxID=458696 RepID=A0A7J7CMI2_TRIWF|nr:putative Disease resistance protein RPM1 [Tripterygium wilfordii]
MLTTRIMDVAEFCKFHSLVHVHEVQSLPRDKALELLCNKAFQFEDHQQCPPELTELATYIVEKCEGLPLAIVAIGGVLSSKGKDISQWQNLCNILREELESNPQLVVVAKFKLVKMIDLEGAPLHSLPEEFGHLFNLRYLCLKNTKLKELPKSFAGLQNLETLDLRQSQVREISFELNRLQKLRHLRIFNEDYSVDFSMASLRGFKIHGGYGSLQDLQTLNYLEADHGVNLLIDLRKLTNLKKLGVTKLTRENGKDLCIAVEKMKQLEYLNVCSTSVDDVLDLQFISSPPQSLWHLTLRGPLQKLPDWIRALQNLTTIVLDWSGLADDSLRVLEDLLNLSSLCLRQAYDGQDLHFKEGGFQKLKLLKLLELKELKMVMICKGALPLLENLHIGCSQLMEVPSGIQYLRMLENLELYDMPKELIETLLPHCGKNNWMIAHVPVIWVNIKLQGRLHDSYTLQSLKMSEIATTTMPRMRRGRLGFGQWPNGSKYGGN